VKQHLYLWPDHQRDWMSGVCFALALSEAEARRLICAHEDNYEEPVGAPLVLPIDKPFGFSRSGGG
jgi:hypothetical protein